MDKKWILLVGILAVLLQIVGFVSPGWMRFEFVDVGLWYVCAFDTCVLNIRSSDDSANFEDFQNVWLEYQIEATIGLVAGVVGLFLTCLFVRGNSSNQRNFMTIACIAFLISGIAAWIPAGKIPSKHYGLWSYFEVPYSIILTAMGATLALTGAILIFLDACRAERQAPQTGYPMQTVQYQPNTGYPPQGYPSQGYPSQDYPSQGFVKQ